MSQATFGQIDTVGAHECALHALTPRIYSLSLTVALPLSFKLPTFPGTTAYLQERETDKEPTE
jgi:hypothetical protein